MIKTGVRMISVSYSSISLAEIAQKLHLESAEDAEYIAAKAIRDGVIEAVLDHKAGTMSSKVFCAFLNRNKMTFFYNFSFAFCRRSWTCTRPRSL